MRKDNDIITRKLNTFVLGISLALLFLPAFLHAQDRSAYGLNFGVGAAFHSADFRAFPGVPSCCPAFQSGTGFGFSVAASYQTPLSQRFRLALRTGYSSFGADLIRREEIVVAGNIPGIFEHRVSTSLADFGVETIFGFNPTKSLWLNVGARAGTLITKNFSQIEQIIQPSNGLFPNGTSVRNEISSTAIPSASAISAGLLTGLRYDVPLNSARTLFLSPEAQFLFPLTNLVENIAWNVRQLRFGLTFAWSPLAKQFPVKIEEKKEKIDTIRKKFLLSATIKANGINPKGEESPTVKIRVEEFSSLVMTPLLNSVFFAENSAEIPERYRLLSRNEADNFTEKSLNAANRLEIYSHILNIIGQRMREESAATLTLTGSNADIGAEKGNLSLSQKRAEAVKTYLTERWNIAENRIRIEQRNLPERAALSQNADGAEENRRVEISSENSALFALMVNYDTLRTVNPPIIRFRPQVRAEKGIRSWSLKAEQAGAVLKTFDGKGNIPDFIEWNVGKETAEQPRKEVPLRYILSITDSANQTYSIADSMDVEQMTIHRKRVERIADKEIRRFSLIVFDIRSTELSAVNKKNAELMKEYIKPTSVVRITGYSDRLGEASLNQQLAEGRARNTAVLLGIPKDSEFVRGVGNATTYNPDLPEGRFYTRTVEVMIETPVNEE